MPDPLTLIFSGCSNPYDVDDENSPVYLGEDGCRVAALAIIDGLLRRRGISHALEDIDYDVRKEIVEEMTEVVRRATKSS
jgi:hypothetical protein